MKKNIEKNLSGFVALHSGLWLLIVGLLVTMSFAGLHSQVHRLEDRVVCQNGSVGLDGSCWLSVPQKKSYQNAYETCVIDNLQVVRKEQLEQMASSLFVMGMLLPQTSLWTADTESCGKRTCQVVFDWQEGKIQKRLVQKNSNNQFSTLCVGAALAQKSKKIQVLLPYNSLQAY